MKFSIYSLLIISLALLTACNDQLQKEVIFGFTASSDGSTWSGDTLIVSKSTPVTFSFTGNAEIISFYSGETGHELSKRNLLQTAISDIDSCYLTFTNKPQFGTIPGSLKVYLSTKFQDLNLANKTNDSLWVDKNKDSLAIMNEKWIELTDSCNLSTVSNVTKTSKISLKSYAQSAITLAFLYKTTDNTTIQPTWQLANLKVVVRDKKGIVTSVPAGDFAFGALDILNFKKPYAVSTGLSGVWDLSNVAAASSLIKIVYSSIGQSLNTDWLISSPRILTSRVPDLAVAVKGISNRVDTYQYKFNTSGVYQVGFLAQNANYKYTSELTKSIIIKVK